MKANSVMRRQPTDFFRFRLSSEGLHCRTHWIGVLEGSWLDIGRQYGGRCGKDIAWNFDVLWESNVLRGKSPWQENRCEAKRAEYALRYVQKSFEELSILSPELIELFQGMAIGASSELDQCANAKSVNHFDKIALLNYSSMKHLHPNWDYALNRPSAASSKGRLVFAPENDGDCNGLWVKGDATSNGQTYAARTAQSTHLSPTGTGRERQVSYVAIPSDPNGRVFWGNGRAGNLGGIGGGLLNDCGVCCLTSGAQYSKEGWAAADQTLAPGIKDFLLASYGVIFSKTAEEAAKRVTRGTERYRRQTGRETVLRARGANIVFADASDAFCIEQTARHYAIRKPGYLGEHGSNYLVHANHFKFAGGSYDEHNVFHDDQPMSGFAPEEVDAPNGTYYRFWSGMWMLRNGYGTIDEHKLKDDILSAHYGYDERGTRYDPDPESGFPTVGSEKALRHDAWHGTFCAHIGPFAPDHPLGVGGNAETTLFNLSTLDVWWVPAWPCHFKEWSMDWNFLNLRLFSDYRNRG